MGVKKKSSAPENDVQAPPAAMASVRAANGGNARRVPRSGKPIVNGRADAAALDRRLARPVMTGNEQDDPVARVNRLLENTVDRSPRGVEGHPVEVEHPIRLGRARAELPVPARVERSPELGTGWYIRRNWTQPRLASELSYVRKLLFFFRFF